MTENIERLYFKTYLAVVHNAIGTKMFRNFYIRTDGGPITDAIGNGENACAFFVTSVLLLFNKQKSVHATVKSAIKDLEESEWLKVSEDEMIPGDVLIWDKRDNDDPSMHIGFYIGKNQAISTSSSKGEVVQHDVHFGELNRKIIGVYRMTSW